MRQIPAIVCVAAVVALAPTSALAEQTPEAAKAEMAEMKVQYADNAQMVQVISMIETMMAADPARGMAAWAQLKTKLGAALEKKKAAQAAYPLPEPGKITFSNSVGGPPVASTSIDKPIYGAVELSAPVKAWNQAYASPPGSLDFDHGDLVLKVTVDGKIIFDGEPQLWMKDYQERTRLPLLVIGGEQTGECCVFTETESENNITGRLWEARGTKALYEEYLLGMFYDGFTPGTHEIGFALYPSSRFTNKPPIAKGTLKVEVTKAAQAKLAKRSKRKAAGKAGGKYAKLDKDFLALFRGSRVVNEEGWKVRYVRSQTKWNQTFHWHTHKTIKRSMRADAVVETDHGCYIVPNLKYCEDSTHDTGGAPFTSPRLCESLGQVTPGSQDMRAIPCSRAK